MEKPKVTVMEVMNCRAIGFAGDFWNVANYLKFASRISVSLGSSYACTDKKHNQLLVIIGFKEYEANCFSAEFPNERIAVCFSSL